MRPLSQNRRIICNALATYGRSVFAMLLGLFSARWIYLSLGVVDFGLYGVVGSIIIFITFLNGVLGSSVTRFYAYAIGESREMDPSAANVLLRGWFNTALAVHTFVPILLIGIGYPIGIWAIEHWLTVPLDRVATCVVVFRLSLVTAFISMVSIPYTAFYTAYQDIVELSLFGIAQTCLMFAAAVILLVVDGDRLRVYALLMMLIQAGIPILQMLRAHHKYPVCRLNLSDWLKWSIEKRSLFRFASFQLFGNCGTLMRHQACALLTNKYFGPRINAAYGVSGQVLGHAGALSSALVSAFMPAITTAEGSGNREQVKRYALRMSCFGAFLLLLFLIPLGLEIDEVLRLWLKSPPEWARVFCLVAFVEVAFDKMTIGQQLAIMAQGDIGRFQLITGGTLMMALPIAWGFVLLDCGPLSMALAMIVTTSLAAFPRVYFAWRQLAISPLRWVLHVVFPVMAIGVIACFLGWLPQVWMQPSFVRVCLTTVITVPTMAICGWFIILDSDERHRMCQFVKAKLGVG